MQPHDELYHYGVKGMKWGVRRQLARANKLERGAQGIEAEAREIRRGNVPKKYRRVGNYYGHPTKGQHRREDLADAFDLAGKMDRAKAAELRARAENAGRAPMRSVDQTRAKSSYEHAFRNSIIGGGVGTLAGGLANRILVPLTGYSVTPFGAGLIGASVGGASTPAINRRS